MIDRSKLFSWYDFQAPFYRLWRHRYDGELVRRVVSLLPAGRPRARALDAACGTGLFSIGLAQRLPGWHIEGLDASKGMLAVAATQAGSLGLQNLAFRRGDVEAMPYSEAAFDTVVAGGLFPNLNESRPALRAFHRVLKPGGQLLVVEIDREALSTAMRLFFGVMILGYRAVSFVVRRFRFAEGWNVEASTIDRGAFERDARESGFEVRRVERVQGHLVFDLVKGKRTCRDS